MSNIIRKVKTGESEKDTEIYSFLTSIKEGKRDSNTSQVPDKQAHTTCASMCRCARAHTRSCSSSFKLTFCHRLMLFRLVWDKVGGGLFNLSCARTRPASFLTACPVEISTFAEKRNASSVPSLTFLPLFNLTGTF